ncbi:hypothetical protein TFLX_01860 [Thermoflexales bacterium]|nr:hypothetical protein TFLX_01860 [Thermoflexales bacterium]
MTTITTLQQRPDLESQFRSLDSKEWPKFMLQGSVPNCHRGALFTSFADFQIVSIDHTGTLVGIGSAVPIFWDGTIAGLPNGWDAAFEQAVSDCQTGRLVNTLVGMSVTIDHAHQKQGLGSMILRSMHMLAAQRSFTSVIVPARPILKKYYPLIPMKRYIEWKRTDGSVFDPWLQVHYRLGAKPLCIAPRSMVITGAVAEWEEWTSMCFPESGLHLVPGALQPVKIDCGRDLGSYFDPNVWVHYPIA